MSFRTVVFILLFTHSFSLLANDRDSESRPDHNNVEWYRPENYLSDNPERSQVLLSGKTWPGTKIELEGEEIILLNEQDEIQQISKREVYFNESALADGYGYFELLLELPFATAQLPIKVQAPGSEAKFYQINLLVKKNESALANMKSLKASPYASRRWGLWGGLGYNYLKYDQTSNIPSSVSFESFAVPAIYLRLVRNFELWQTQVTYTQAPGKTSSSSQITVLDGDYKWTIFTADATYWHPQWKTRVLNQASQFGVLGGIQYHLLPFVSRSSPTNPRASSIETNPVVMASLGGVWHLIFSKFWQMESFVRYQLPVQSGSVFKIAPIYGFDGSVGLIYKWKPDWRLGVFCYGQFQNYKFSNHEDTYLKANGSANPNISGEQKILFSNIEARFGWEFD